VVDYQQREFNLTRIYRLCNVELEDRTDESEVAQVTETLESKGIIESSREHSGETWYKVPEINRLVDAIEDF